MTTSDKIYLSFIIIFIVGGAYFAYITFFQDENINVTVTDLGENRLSGDEYRDQVEKIQQMQSEAIDVSYGDRDYEKGIELYKQLVEESEKISDDAKIKTEIELAGKYLRNDHERAYEYYAELYHREGISDRRKAEILRDVFWSFASSYNDRGMDLQFAREKIFSEDRFGFLLPEDYELTNRATVIAGGTYGFEKALELNPSTDSQYLTYMLLAHYLPSRFTWDLDNPDQQILERMQSLVQQAYPAVLDSMSISLQEDEYNAYVATSLFYGGVRTNLLLNYTGIATPSDFTESVVDTLDYVEPFKNQHYNAIVFAAETTMQHAVGTLMFNDLDPNAVDQDFIRSNLEKHVYNLSDEDLARRTFITSRGENPQVVVDNYPDVAKWALAYQQALIVIANDIDPRFKDFLLDRNVRGWRAVDFEDPEWKFNDIIVNE